MKYMIQNNIKQFANTYGSEVYGGNRYSASETHQETDGGARLPDTGMDVVVGITGGVLLIAVAVGILVTAHRKRTKK